MPKSNEELIKFDIVKILESKGWKSGTNLFLNQGTPSGREADIILTERNNKENILIVIEVKDRDKNLEKALNEQAIPYAHEWKTPIAYATDGNIIKTFHLPTSKPLFFNGTEINEFLTYELAQHYLSNNEYNDADQRIIISRPELIRLFFSINKDLRKGFLQAGIERFGELCNILFLKLFSEQEEIREKEEKEVPRIESAYRWNRLENKPVDELLSWINDTVLEKFRKEYGKDIFPLCKLKILQF